jgi:hypothetical protein
VTDPRSPAAIASQIAKFMDEHEADGILEHPVEVGSGEAVAGELRKRGFVVIVEPRYQDAARSVIAREVLRINRSA